MKTQSSDRFESLSHLLGFLWPFIRHYRLQVLGAMAALFLAAGAVLTICWGLRHLVDQGLQSGSPGVLNQALLMMIGIVSALALASAARYFMVSWLGERVIADLRKKLYAHIVALDPPFFDRYKTGNVLSRMTADTTIVQQVVSQSLSIALRNSLMTVGSLIMLCYTSPKLTAYVIGLLPLVILPLVLVGRRVRVRSRQAQEHVGVFGDYIDETLHGVQEIQAYGQEDTTAQHFAGLTEDVFQASCRYIRLRAVITAIAIFVIFAGISTVLWLGGHDMLDGEMTAGTLSAFIFYAVVLASSVGALSEVYGALNHAAGAADRLTEILKAAPDIITAEPVQSLPDKLEGSVTFQNVQFAYPAHPDRTVLHDVDFTVPSGKAIAIIGASGAGKSTLFQLAQRFYDPAKGQVLIDGMDLKHIPPAEIRSHIAVVPQEPVIFSSSVFDNIRFGKPGASRAEVKVAAVAANADGFIQSLPDGYDTLLGERGSRLSTGQKQRIAIARAVLRDPEILLLDEATSALDSESENKVQEALARLMKNRTTLIIAHRLSTIQDTDEIIVLDQGRVVEQGTHYDLNRKKGLYYRYVQMQIAA
jgi:ATP-binding cassette subfamily B protein